jgi:hypothetical protein
LSSAFANDSALWGKDSGRPVQATQDGRFLVFTSYGDLVAGDTSTASQVFQYDAQTDTLVRVSIGQNGLNNNGNATDSGTFRSSDATITNQDYNHQSSPGGALARTMSDDGGYVFFESPVQLTANALDQVLLGLTLAGEPRYAQNIYEYHDGNVYLISDGQDVTAGESFVSNVSLVGTDSSGSDVFFRIADSLVSQDTDTQVDFYDARIDGGFQGPTASTCRGEGCQGSLSAPPMLGASGSATLAGTENLAAPPATGAPKPPTRAQKLARALKACHSKHNRHKRAVCERQARKRYGATKAKKASHTTTPHKGVSSVH